MQGRGEMRSESAKGVKRPDAGMRLTRFALPLRLLVLCSRMQIS